MVLSPAPRRVVYARLVALVVVLVAGPLAGLVMPVQAISWNPVDWVSGDANSGISKQNRKAAAKAQTAYEEALQEAQAARAAANAAREQTVRLNQSAKLAEARAAAAKRVVEAYQQQTAPSQATAASSYAADDAPLSTAAVDTPDDEEEGLKPISEPYSAYDSDNNSSEATAPMTTASAASETAHKRSWMPQSWNPMAWLGLSDEEAKQQAAAPQEVASAKPAQKQSISSRLEDSDATAALPAMPYTGAVIETQKGNITIGFYKDQAPETVRNFMQLASTGFYNNINMKFHRVIPGFVVQTGDPTGTGAGGSGKRIPLEVDNKLSHEARGMVAMARGPDPNSATSQFYITLAPQKTLDGKYAVFAHVISGMDVLDKIEKDDRVYGVQLIDAATVARDVDPNDKKFLKWF